jgi:copper chaperone NosL
MSRRSVAILWIAVGLFLAAYIFPLWSISLDAPQYPEGMGMKIWVDKITGEKSHDLQNINGLNHYIGMRKIDANSIPELRYMRYIIAGLVAFGVAAAITRRLALAAAWVAVCVAVSIVGLADFYKWAHDYGHNLDPDAPIKVPGMSYQPPLFGTKQLLNITATSLPDIGGAALILGVGLGALAVFVELVRRRRATSDHTGPPAPRQPVGSALSAAHVTIGALAATVALVASSCSVEPRPIEFGKDACEYCRMTISDERYGAELVTKKGRVYKYDSIECMAEEMSRDGFDAAGVKFALTVDYAEPQRLVDARTSVYLHSPTLRSPMGMNLTSFAERPKAEAVAEQHPGELLAFDEVLVLVARASRAGSGHR